MSELKIDIDGEQNVFVPGAEIRGRIRWSLEEMPKQVRLAFFWYTQGKGTQDSGLVDELVLESPGAYGDSSFTFLVPQGPCSFSGSLISLIWALELTSKPGKDVERKEIVVSTTGEEIRLS